MQNENKRLDVLLIEDNPADIFIFESTVKDLGLPCNISYLTNGYNILNYFSEKKNLIPDIIILDLNLPGLNGKEILCELKRNKKTETIPVVVFTNSDSEMDVYLSYKLNANCYITKPRDFDKFVTILRSLIEFWNSIAILPPKNYKI